MIAQMAATAGSVAIGSTIGHGISSMLFGGSSQAAPAESQAAPVQQQQTNANCAVQAKGTFLCLGFSTDSSLDALSRLHHVP